MASTTQQAVRAGRAERLIALMAPVLDLVLTVGDRVSRAVGPEDDYYPIRSAGEEPLPLASSQRSRDPGSAGMRPGATGSAEEGVLVEPPVPDA